MGRAWIARSRATRCMGSRVGVALEVGGGRPACRRSGRRLRLQGRVTPRRPGCGRRGVQRVRLCAGTILTLPECEHRLRLRSTANDGASGNSRHCKTEGRRPKPASAHRTGSPAGQRQWSQVARGRAIPKFAAEVRPRTGPPRKISCSTRAAEWLPEPWKGVRGDRPTRRSHVCITPRSRIPRGAPASPVDACFTPRSQIPRRCVLRRRGCIAVSGTGAAPRGCCSGKCRTAAPVHRRAGSGTGSHRSARRCMEATP